MGRLETIGLLDGSAVGGGLFAKIESAQSPALVLHHQQIFDGGAGERVGVTQLLFEPRIVTDQHVTMFWNIGAVGYGSEDGFVNGGVHIGFGASITPIQPLLVEARFGIQTLAGWTAVLDVTAQVGVEVRTGEFAVIGYRGLGGDVSPLHMVTVGVQIDLGSGGRGATAHHVAQADR